MSQLPIFSQKTDLLNKLNLLQEQIPLEHRRGLSVPFRSKIQRISELYSSIEPRSVLLELLEKSSGNTSRKNWKFDETSYLIYIIDKYCLLHQIDTDTLEVLDWEHISEYLPGRSANSCQFRFLSLVPNSISDAPWLCSER